MRRLCECGLHRRSDHSYPRLVEFGWRTESICTSREDPIAEQTRHATYVPGRRYGTVQVRLPAWVFDRWWGIRRMLREFVS